MKADQAHRVFVRYPAEMLLAEQCLDEHINRINEAVHSGRYSPAGAVYCEIPKGLGAIRPGVHLNFSDRLVYSAVVGACMQYIVPSLNWSKGSVDFSYLLNADLYASEWIEPPFKGWKTFSDSLISNLDRDVRYVVFADIAGCYEGILLETLSSDLRQLGTPTDTTGFLSRLLNKWVCSPGRGIPQGHSPSDILAKVYLNRVDEQLRDLGLRHIRYVDDYRILCSSAAEAKRAIADLSKMLRHRGLRKFQNR